MSCIYTHFPLLSLIQARNRHAGQCLVTNFGAAILFLCRRRNYLKVRVLPWTFMLISMTDAIAMTQRNVFGEYRKISCLAGLSVTVTQAIYRNAVTLRQHLSSRV